MLSVLLSTVSLVAQVEPPTSRPTSRPERPLSDRERVQRHDWGPDAPGSDAVGGRRFLPIKGGRYGTFASVRDRVRGKDLVIGLTVGDKAFAYPINMLGGPTREIVNDEFDGVRFCVNW